MVTTQAELLALSDEAANRIMNQQGTASGQRVGWLMILTILIEAWDLYSIGFLLVFIKPEFHASPAMVGLASGAVQLGAVFGTLLGGWIADRLGRKRVFIATMIMFIVLALAQGFVTNIWQLVLIRFLLGFPLGSDISSGYAYIMEAMPRGRREVMGNRWLAMFALGEVLAALVTTAMFLAGMPHNILWRVGLALGAVPALLLLTGRLRISDTALSLIQRGKFRQAKEVARKMFGDDLDMLPNEDFEIQRPSTAGFLKSIWADPIRRRSTIFAWISNACHGAEFGAFAFYLPTILIVAGISKNNLVATNLLTAAIFCVALVSGFVGPAITPWIGHRGISQSGYGMAFIFLLVTAVALWLNLGLLLPFAAAAVLWGHFSGAANSMTIASMVAPTRYKGTASGFGYTWLKLAAFITVFGFPILLAAVGNAMAMLVISLIPLIGFLAARYILPEVYGYVEQEAATLAWRASGLRMGRNI